MASGNFMEPPCLSELGHLAVLGLKDSQNSQMKINFSFPFFTNPSVIFLIKCGLIFSVLSRDICICEINKTLLEFLCSSRNNSSCLMIKDWI